MRDPIFGRQIKHLFDVYLLGRQFNHDVDCFSTHNVRFKLTLFVCTQRVTALMHSILLLKIPFPLCLPEYILYPLLFIAYYEKKRVVSNFSFVSLPFPKYHADKSECLASVRPVMLLADRPRCRHTTCRDI